MERWATQAILASAIGGLALSAGCNLDLDILLPSEVTVTLVNSSSDFPVESTIIYDKNDLPQVILVELGTTREDVIGPGSTVSFMLDCDDVEVILLEDADLRVIGSVGPSVDGDVLRMDDDFDCGDEIVLTFTHSILIVDFDVAITVR